MSFVSEGTNVQTDARTAEAEVTSFVSALYSRRQTSIAHIDSTMTAFPNNLHDCLVQDKLCKAFGVKISSNVQTVLLARNAGYDALWIDLEHGWLTLGEASNLCLTSLLAGMTPLVRVPHQCGNGFIQRVLDGGAMGVIFPHIHGAGMSGH